MPHGKTIELFLVNGTAESIIIAELSNWNGQAIKIPRAEVPQNDREELRKPGVYFLFCRDPNGADSVYIGEAENVQERLMQHIRVYKANRERYYWNDAVVFVGRDLNKAHIRYMEDRFVKIARECNRYRVLTKNTYGNTNLKESQKATLEEFIDNVRILINALNYRIFVPIERPSDETVRFYCRGNNGDAHGYLSTGGFTVEKGSTISDHTVPSFETQGRGYFRLRNQLIDDGIIADRIFASDFEFPSPSAASSVILGHTSNGNNDWRTEDGTRLKDTQEV